MLADAAAIAAVHRSSRADYYQEPADLDDDRDAMWRHLLAEPAMVIHVAEASRAVAGSLSAHRSAVGVPEVGAGNHRALDVVADQLHGPVPLR